MIDINDLTEKKTKENDNHFSEFSINEDKIIDNIKQNEYNLVGLQFPEGVKKLAFSIAKRIENETDADAFISGNPCFGACDIDTELLKNVDVLFHFGHSQLEFTEIEKKVVFIEMFSSVSLEEVVKKATEKLKEKDQKQIPVVTTIQHVKQLDSAAEILRENGFEPIITKGDGRIKHPGQVLGCNFSSAKNACNLIKSESGTEENFDFDILYIGSGQFHPIGVSLSTKKRVICADPYTQDVFEINLRKHLMKRSAVIGNSIDSRNIGILVSTKNGQNRIKLAKTIKKMAEENGMNGFIISMDLITPSQLLAFKADAFVNTACPRIAIDDSGNYPAPVMTPQEFEILVGVRDWDDLELDEILE